MAITESSAQYNLDNKIVHSDNINHSSNKVNLDPEPIDFDECIKDSPKFRHSLRENLTYVEHLESHMAKAIKQVSNLIDTGREYAKSQKDFIQSMRALSNVLGPKNINTSKRVNTLLETWQEIMKLQEVVIDQSARTVGGSFSKFINEDLARLREARKSFDKISNEYDQALLKYSQPIKKQQEDAENFLIATSTAFTHTSLDLSIQLTTLQSKKGYEILESLLSLSKAHRTYFHQGFDLFEDLQPHISDMEENVGHLQDEFETLTRNLPSKHLLVHNNELRPPTFDSKAQQVHLEGYLFKRASNGFRVWNRRWFILKDHKLVYQKRSDLQPITMEEDLRLLTVRPVDKVDNDRRFCFEIVSPHKSHILQADSEVASKTWMSAIQAGINAAFHDTEHKSRPPMTSTELANAAVATNNATATTGASASFSSWGGGFSLKSLQQQATSKLTSLTNLNDTRETTPRGGKDSIRKLDDHTGGESDNEDCPDENQEGEYEDQGRGCYAPLKDCDDDFKAPQAPTSTPRSSGTEQVTTYPVSAVDTANSNSGQSTTTTTTTAAAAPPEKPQRAYMIILAMPGNDLCADCDAPQPRWASINLGITLCIECAGIHRSLGVHLSKVRSLTLDTDIWSPEIVQLMLSLGNSSVNSAYLACYRDQRPKIHAESSREERESWIKDKYLVKRFMRTPDVKLDDSLGLNESASCEAGGADPVVEQQEESAPSSVDRRRPADVVQGDGNESQ